MTRFRFVEAEAAQFPVSLLCRVVGVTRQGFYAWKGRPPNVALLLGAEFDAELERRRELAQGQPAEKQLQLPPRDPPE